MQSNKEHALDWLTRRGISRQVISSFDITWYNHPVMGGCIRIPIDDQFAKYRRDPLSDAKPKYTSDKGSKTVLFGADKLRGDEKKVVITEGELDTLVLWSLNIPAVSSTGGARAFKPEWRELLPEEAEYYICYDNDDAGAEGALNTRAILGTTCKVILIPETVGVKDISDFIAHGGDFVGLMQSAQAYPDATSVEEDIARRKPQWLSTRFHEAFLDKEREKVQRQSKPKSTSLPTDEVLRARSYPMTNLLDFSYGGKARCPFHDEKTPSLHYYEHTNSAYCFGACGRAYDAIDVYRLRHPKATFREAVKALNDMV